ncbi:hypothetical protein [Flavisolibacter tropicus]|uniref:hypothetical protein n=1 Tax=Flavisolibacter tropicus TaxID=1492898 RepID=UPI00131446C8|nr:hypothetical protein [Flavisolibacter tropicus]
MKKKHVMIVVIAIALPILFHHVKTYKSAEQAPNKAIAPKTNSVTKEVDLFTNISFWS